MDSGSKYQETEIPVSYKDIPYKDMDYTQSSVEAISEITKRLLVIKLPFGLKIILEKTVKIIIHV